MRAQGIYVHHVLCACCHYVLSCSVVRYFVTARCKLFYILSLEERDTEVREEL